jgi:alpha-glucosidase (family GH31 glycosyl hydrolase)
MKRIILFAAALLAAASAFAQSFDITLDSGAKMRVEACSNDIFRVRITEGNDFPESIMLRYGIFRSEWDGAQATIEQDDTRAAVKTAGHTLTVDKATGEIKLTDADGGEIIKSITYSDSKDPSLASLADKYNAQFRYLNEHVNIIGSDHWEQNVDAGVDITDKSRTSALRFALGPDTRIYGGGSVSRKHLQHRGEILRIFTTYANTENVNPFMMTSDGWAVLNNTTNISFFDCGVSEPDKMIALSTVKDADFYLMTGGDMMELLRRYHDIAGNNYLLPRWAYGCCFGPHLNADGYVFMNEAVKFMEQGYPMDMMWVEPQWMETYYDWTVNKKWDYKKFPGQPYWYSNETENGEHGGSFISRMHALGYKICLWLNIDTDLSVMEEDRLAHENGGKLSGQINWFDHLRKFMSNGVDGFKLDPGQTVDRHPNRKYYNGLTDAEMHEVNQVLLPKQFLAMNRDFRPARSFHHYCGGFAGTQHYTAATTGDSGGGVAVLYDQLNLQMSGYNNTSCDVGASTDGLHMGIFLPWMQINSWYSFKEPWYQPLEAQTVYRNYLRLRNQMVPYTYSGALKGSVEGDPVMMPMPMAFPDDRNCDDLAHEYMYGEGLLITVFTDEVYLPEGVWYDFWTNKKVTSAGESIPAEFDKSQYGGPVYVKDGAIIPFQHVARHACERPLDTLVLNIWPADKGEYTFWEDDGTTYEHENGAIAKTRFSYEKNRRKLVLNVDAVEGRFEGMHASRTYDVKMTLDRQPRRVKVAGKRVKDVVWDKERKVVTFCAEHPDTAQSLEIKIKL